MDESWTEYAQRIGAAEHGAESLTATCIAILGDHVGTHCDAVRHIDPAAGGSEEIPLEYCFGDGVLLDFRDRPPATASRRPTSTAPLPQSTTG
jgi:kynurenine formamidase